MKDLETLWLMDNRITKLPGGLGFIKTLNELCVHGNPGLTVPSIDVIAMGIEHVKWHLRQQKWKERRGDPPPIKTLKIGIKEEVFLPEIRRDTNINENMENANETKVLTVNWKGLVRYYCVLNLLYNFV